MGAECCWKGCMLITILAAFYFIRLKLALCGKLLKTKQNSEFSSSPKVPHKQKSTHEIFVSAWFSSSGTQDVSVARWAPSNPLCPFALYPRKLFGVSLWDFCVNVIRPGRCAPWLSIVIYGALKSSFQRHKCQCPAPSGRPDAYKRKKHSGLLCFLVAGRRIELRTSWLWIHIGRNLWKLPK